MIRIRVVEIGAGVWRAEIEGEENSAAISQAPDRALAALIRENLHRFGVDEVTYRSDVAPPGESAGVEASHGPTAFPVSGARETKRGG